jgi:protein-S-isoprenylcysteine O-methyltransferase Ste14
VSRPRGFAAIAAIGGLLAAAPVAAAAALSGRPAGWVLAAAITGFAALEALVSPADDRRGSLAEAAGSLATALMLLAMWIVAAATATAPGTALIVGAALFATGAGLRIAAIATLGERFCSSARAAPAGDFETSGVFRLRHPSELGNLLLGAGAVVMAWSVAELVLLAALVGLIAARTIAEERQSCARPLLDLR